jgi:hypothetical protein
VEERTEELLNESEYRGPIRSRNVPVQHLTPIRVHGGVGP